MREVGADLEAWLRLAPTPVAVDVSAIRGAMQAKLGAEIAAHDLRAERKQLALRPLRGLQERMRPLNDALRELHPGAQIDGTDRLTENVIPKVTTAADRAPNIILRGHSLRRRTV